ncbi:MAG: fumarylacetoacetate hydrolase family protein [Chloroflexi bacterium]|nr:fumarylacetoacetate hydrolase family protein [Chloroflexota bacterium]
MRLISYRSGNQVRSARLMDGHGLDLNISGALYKKNNLSVHFSAQEFPTQLVDWFLLGADGLKFAQEATEWVKTSSLDFGIEIKDGPVFDLNHVSLLAPIPRPGKVICIAGNYPGLGIMEKPEYPTVFLKPSGGVIGNGQAVVIPEKAINVAYEVELAVVIGKRSRNLTLEEVGSSIAGYTIANDIGDRLFEKRTSQWTTGKMFDTFTPMGPVLLTPDELDETGNLSMFTKVNGQLLQKGSTSQMFFNTKDLVCYISTLTTLEVGDVILTGSPKLMDGNANPIWNLSPGDLVEVEIDKIGSLINLVKPEEVVK